MVDCLHIQGPYSEGGLLVVFYVMVQVTKEVITHYSYALEVVEWAPTMDEKNPQSNKKVKIAVWTHYGGPSSSIRMTTPAWFGLHMSNDFNWGKKNPAVLTCHQSYNFKVDNTLRAVKIEKHRTEQIIISVLQQSNTKVNK
jgi:hypothetical protein